MTGRKGFPPRRIGRFNYWEFFRPDGLKVVDPLKQYIRQQFHLVLNASPPIWNREVYPWLHKKLADIPDRRFLALEGYVLDDKEWRCDADAWKVYKQLSPRQKNCILQLEKEKWHHRSQWTWDELIKRIADDQDRFESFLETPDTKNIYGTDRRIYEMYHRQANKLLSRTKHPLSLKDRRQAKKETLHWFHHALRNMREYRNNRPPVSWSPKCATTCRRIQKKLRNA